MKTYSAEEKHAGTLALRIAQFVRDVDPYEFADNMEPTETQHDAVFRMAKDIYGDILTGNVDGLIDFLMEYEIDCDDYLAYHRDKIIRDLNKLSSSKTISKNPLKIETAKKKTATKKARR